MLRTWGVLLDRFCSAIASYSKNCYIAQSNCSMRFNSLPHLIDQAERSGRLDLRTADLADLLPGISPESLRQALDRQRRRGRIVRTARGSGHWLIVPLQDATVGAPALETWLHSFVARTLQEPYYVGLLSAAESYGASPFAVMVTQIVVPRPRRPLQVGRHQLQFIGRKNVSDVPTQWHETPAGRFRVSSPAATAFELVARQGLVGGPSRVLAVLQALGHTISEDGLRQALQAMGEPPTAQRLGVLFLASGQPALADVVSTWLRARSFRTISLSPDATAADPFRLDRTFKVRVPSGFTGANS